MDPLELRLRNYAETDQVNDKPYSSPRRCAAATRRAAEAFGWQRPGSARSPANGPKRRGIGFAAHDWIGGAGHPPGYAWVKLNATARPTS